MKDKENKLDDFLAENAPEAEALNTLAALTGDLELVAPPDPLLQRIVGEATHVDRFDRFVATVGKLLDLSNDAARGVCNQIDDPDGWFTDPSGLSEQLWIEGGPGVSNAVTGFVRVNAGNQFPEHKHLGEEHVLVMQGSFIDSIDGTVARPGDIITRGPNTEHSFYVPEGGPDVLLLAIVNVGYEVDGHRFGPEDRPG
jgi:quercetin dioxygenase-like cupin family protein